jgi:hypothetical protein
MSGGGGSSSDGGGNDMQVSGAEAAYSTEKGISTYSDTRTSSSSYNDRSNTGSGERHNPHTSSGTSRADLTLGPDRSTVGIAASDPHSDREIERGYTDDGQKLSNVNGVYMTKSEMYNKGIVEKDPNTGEEVMGRNRVNPVTGELERADLSFAEHFANSPVKFSPMLSFLYASGKNIGEYFEKKGFKGYNEAGLRGYKGNASDFYNDRSGSGLLTIDADRDSQIMKDLAPEAPYIVSGTKRPTNSPAANWYQSLGNTSTSGFQFSFANELAAAKAKQASILGNPTAIGQLAVSNSPFYNWLKERSLDKGIL